MENKLQSEVGIRPGPARLDAGDGGARVLTVAPLYHSSRGGLGRQAKLLTEALADRGLAMRVVTRLMKGLPPEPQHPAVPIARLRNPRPNLHNYDQATVENLILSLSWTGNLLRLLRSRRDDYDIAHFHGASLPLILAAPLLKSLGKTTVALVAGTDQGVEAGDLRHRYGPLGRLFYRSLSAVDGWIAISPQIEQALLREGYPEARVHAIPNMVETDRFRPFAEHEIEHTRDLLGIPRSARVVLAVGRLVALKGIDVLLDAFQSVAAAQPAARLVIVGDGPERARLEALARRPATAGRVDFLGFREDLPALYSAADLVCLPSFREGLPNVMLEAMACGRPVVASELGGTLAAIDPETGVLVPPGDSASLAAALTTLLIDRSRRRLMGQAARHNAVERYSPKTVVDRTLHAYEAALGRPLAASPRHLRGARAWQGEAGCSHD